VYNLVDWIYVAKGMANSCENNKGGLDNIKDRGFLD
jgi:hypothetical protein